MVKAFVTCNVAFVAPEMSVPLNRHWKPVAFVETTVNVAVLPGATVWLCGWVVMTGRLSGSQSSSSTEHTQAAVFRLNPSEESAQIQAA